jgi:hypothetical protein
MPMFRTNDGTAFPQLRDRARTFVFLASSLWSDDDPNCDIARVQGHALGSFQSRPVNAAVMAYCVPLRYLVFSVVWTILVSCGPLVYECLPCPNWQDTHCFGGPPARVLRCICTLWDVFRLPHVQVFKKHPQSHRHQTHTSGTPRGHPAISGYVGLGHFRWSV